MSVAPIRQVSDHCQATCGICGDDIRNAIGHLQLECDCVIHFACLVRYIRSKSSLMIFRYKGIVCPYSIAENCSYDGSYYLKVSDLHQLVEYYDQNISQDLSGEDAMSTPFTAEECEKICNWADGESCDQDGDAAELNPYVEATTKACPKCSTRISHFGGHGCHHVMVRV
jgi:hypothetical protein